MEQTVIDKRKTGIFIALSFILSGVIRWLSSIASINFIGYEDVNYARTQTINSATNALSAVLILATFLGFGYLLNKNIRKAAIFAGTLCSANIFSGVVTSLVSAITEIIMYEGMITPTVMANIISIVNIAFIPVNIFIAYFIYTALEGVNPKFPGKSIKDNAMTLSQVKKRFIIAFIITIVVSTIGSLLPGHIVAYLSMYEPASQLAMRMVDLITWVAGTASTVILFAVMYKPGKSFIEAMSFFGAYTLGGKFSSVIITVINAISSVIFYFVLPTTASESYLTVRSVVTVVMSVVGFVLELVFIFMLLKLYFTNEPKATEYQIPTEYDYDSYDISSPEEREAQLQQQIDTIE